MPNSRLRGHPIRLQAGHWFYVDNGQPTAETWLSRGCGHCGKPNTPEGHDACLGTLPGVLNACCGHGDDNAAYAQLDGGGDLRGDAAIRFFKENNDAE